MQAAEWLGGVLGCAADCEKDATFFGVLSNNSTHEQRAEVQRSKVYPQEDSIRPLTDSLT